MAEETIQSGTPAPETPGSTSIESSPTVLGDSSTLLDWRLGLSENVRQSPVISRIHTADAAARALMEQDRMLGRALFLPAEEEGTEAHTLGMSKVYSRLGRPETAAEYELPVPEGYDFDTAIADRWKNTLHQAGVSQTQAREIMNEYWRTVHYAEEVQAGMDQRSRLEGLKGLDAEFGAANAPVILNQARAFMQHMGGGGFGGEGGTLAARDLENAMLPDGSRLLNKPYVVAALAEANRALNREFSEQGYVEGTDYRVGGVTPETMEQQLRELSAKKFSHEGWTAADQAKADQLSRQLAMHRQRSQGRAA